VTDIALHMLDKNKVTDLKNILLQHFILRTDVHWSKLKECIPYALTSTFIDIILQNGANPDFLEKNDNTIEIKKFLDSNADKTDIKLSNVYRSTNLYELYFSTVPGTITRHMKTNWQYILKDFKWATEQMATMFGVGTTIKNFTIRLPFRNMEEEPYISLTLQDYFKKIRSGKISLTELIRDENKTNIDT
jgi:hypothetical protein